MKIEKVIRRVSTDGMSAVNVAVAANIGEPDGSAKARATSVQHAEIVQRTNPAAARQRPSEKES